MRAAWPTVTVVAALVLALAAVRYPGARTLLLGLAVWTALGAFVAVGWAVGRRSGWIDIGDGELLAADPRDPGTWPGVPPLHPVPPLVHQTPPHDAVPQVTPCCSVPLLELPPGSHFSSEPSERTCNRAGGEA